MSPVPSPHAIPALVSTLILGLGGAMAEEPLPERVPLTFIERIDESQAAIRPGCLDLEVHQQRTRFRFPSPSGSVPLERKADGWQVDRNLDGRLDDADLPLVGKDGLFSLPYVFAGKQVAYWFRIQDDGKESASIQGLSRLEGGAGTWRFHLVDDSYVNGRFTDVGSDNLYITATGTGMPVRQPWYPVLTCAGRLWDCALIEDQAILRFTPCTRPVARLGIALDAAAAGAPVVEDCRLTLTEAGKATSLSVYVGDNATGTSTGMTLAGTYRVWGNLGLRLPVTRKRMDPGHPQDGSTDRLTLWPSFPEPFHLAEGGTTLTCGVPDRLVASVCQAEPGLVLVEGVRLIDAHGNAWQARFAGQDGSELAVLFAAGGTETRVGSLEYG